VKKGHCATNRCWVDKKQPDERLRARIRRRVATELRPKLSHEVRGG